MVHGEVLRDFAADLVPEQVGQRFASAGVWVIHDQVAGCGCGITEGEFEGHFGELEAGTVRRRECEVTARFGAENVGRADAFVFVVLSCLASWPSR